MDGGVGVGIGLGGGDGVVEVLVKFVDVVVDYWL